jgi:hypothetical protein
VTAAWDGLPVVEFDLSVNVLWHLQKLCKQRWMPKHHTKDTAYPKWNYSDEQKRSSRVVSLVYRVGIWRGLLSLLPFEPALAITRAKRWDGVLARLSSPVPSTCLVRIHNPAYAACKPSPLSVCLPSLTPTSSETDTNATFLPPPFRCYNTPRSLCTVRRHYTPRLHDSRQAGEEKVLR